MFRHISEPLDAGGLEADVGVEAAGDGLVDDGLLLLLQQAYELLLGVDVASDAPVPRSLGNGTMARCSERGGIGVWKAASFSLVKCAIVALSLSASNHP